MSPKLNSYIPPLNQIALSVVDIRITERWFCEGCGLLPAGGSRMLMRGPLPSYVQGLPGAASTCWWLVGRNPWCQIELFQFESPIAKLMPAAFRPCDTGYTRIGLWVEDFDATLKRLAAFGSQPLTAPLGKRGARRACVRNPDGVYVEIMEDDPLPHLNQSGRLDCTAAIRSVTVSVPKLADAVAYFGKGIGLKPSDAELHTPAHEALWGLAGAKTESKLFDGGDVLLEVVHYLDPVGQPWPKDYRLSDQGILNVAFGARNKRDFDTVYQRATAFGAKPNCKPVHLGGAGVVYVNDKHGFSVEILWLRPGLPDRLFGFEPLPTADRPATDTHRIESSVKIKAPIEKVWDAITDHDNMGQWIGFSPVSLIKEGWTERNGVGSERLMQGPPGAGKMVEQVIAAEAPYHLRYRVTQGSPLVCHQGEVRLKKVGKTTELSWTMRFRPKLPGTGVVLARVLGHKLGGMLRKQLKPYVEGR